MSGTRLQLKRATAAQWTASNFVLLDGEFGYEQDTGNSKIGDGTSGWNSLAYQNANTAPIVYVTAPQFGAKADKVNIADAAMSSGFSVLSSAHTFKSSDVSKLIVVAGAAAAGADLFTTIASVSGGAATLNAAAATTVSGAFATFGAHNTPAFQAANDYVAAKGGGSVVVPAGSYMVGTAIVPADNVHWVGEGMFQSVIFPAGTVHGFFRLGTVGTPLQNLHFTDLAVDGSCQTGLQKGWYLNHVMGGRWTRCRSANTGASGFGCDYLPGGRFINCTAINSGRLGLISTPGCSGFGIGTGDFAVEDVHLIDCTAYGNKRFGAFFENQATATQSKGVQIIGGRYEANQWGISDNGCDGLIVSGAHIVNNVADGFKVNTTAPIHQVGVNGLVTGCVISSNGTGGTGDGVQFDFTQTGSATYGRYAIIGNRIDKNANYGWRVRINGTDPVTELVITDNIVTRNGYSGGAVAGASASASLLTNSEIAGNKHWCNGVAASSGNTYGLHLAASLTSCNVTRNFNTDTAASGKTQTHGLYLATGITVTGGSISDNDCRGNSTAALANSGNATLASPLVMQRNDGFNPIGVDALTVTGSPFSYTAGAQRETLYVIGGTFSAIAINAVTVYNAGANGGSIVIDLDQYATAVFTYSVVPTAIKRYRH